MFGAVTLQALQFDSISAVWITSLGSVDVYVDDLYAAQPLVGPFYFVALLLTLTFLLLNVLISLILKSFEALGERDSHECSTSLLTSLFYWLLCSRGQLLLADSLLAARLGKNRALLAETATVRLREAPPHIIASELGVMKLL